METGHPGLDGREACLGALVGLGVAVAVSTEILGAFSLLRPGPVTALWVAVLLAGALLGRRVARSIRLPRPTALETVWIAGLGAIVALVGAAALASPPNSADPMAYHLPRVVDWAQAGSVSFFPAPYYNQIQQPPLAEYFMLHTWLLSGGDRWVNLVQWLGFTGSLLGVSLVTRALGAGRRGQILAALFCATLPNAILQASGAKNDCLLALWLVAMVHYARRRSTLGTGSALGLALLTKGTAYLFAPAMLAALLLPDAWRERARLLRAAPLLAGCVLLLNGPQYWRNFAFSGSILGYDSAQGDGLFRWRNEKLGLRPTLSNVLRNLADHLGARSPAWNQGVYDWTARAHRWMGAGLDDPATTWRWERYRPPRPSNHEADAPNRWHLLLLVVAGVLLARSRYAAGLVLGFLALCFYLKWMPWMTRLHLPLFVLGAPLAGLAAERIRPRAIEAALCLFLLNNARPYVFENWTRPLTGPRAVWKTPRQNQYFADMRQWDNQATYLRAAGVLRRMDCRDLGIDITHLQLEYPLQALLRAADPSFRFVHTGVANASARYPPRPPVVPCAVVCLDCAGIQEKIDLYRPLGGPVPVDRFLLFGRMQP